ncbi:SixA phosphatase family protein [Stakelama saccharophila]|uniref:Histidine phosphatase family protein n=1 Tax=Stakelama saccharophila TaxID=3075605 RepID=A0ABZ0BA32_9SPHN|nr:histidine phosphatase family protein [Stakelama sp. W311]WNO53971.1 histidine phosphatase family protein [Stakelama sp. W311]
MKTLILLRHAKSGWDDPVERDFDRPLNAKGKRAAAIMGRHARGLGMIFDHVVASPALRVGQTLDHFERGYGTLAAPDRDRRIYLASSATLLELVRELSDAYDHVLLVGHNPGLEDLILALIPDDADEPLRIAVEQKFPTASMVELAFDVDHWADLIAGGGHLERFVRPRDVDASLGPDR